MHPESRSPCIKSMLDHQTHPESRSPCIKSMLDHQTHPGNRSPCIKSMLDHQTHPESRSPCIKSMLDHQTHPGNRSPCITCMLDHQTHPGNRSPCINPNSLMHLHLDLYLLAPLILYRLSGPRSLYHLARLGSPPRRVNLGPTIIRHTGQVAEWQCHSATRHCIYFPPLGSSESFP